VGAGDVGDAVVPAGGAEGGIEGEATGAAAAVPAAAGTEIPEADLACGEAVGSEGAPAEEAGGEAAGGPEGQQIEALRMEVEVARRQAVGSHRRALLAENAGRVVPALVAGETVEALDGSLEMARAAYESVRAATLAELAATSGTGAGDAQRGDAIDVESMSPVQKIAYGLRPARD